MRDDAEVTGDRVGWVSGDVSLARQMAPLGLQSSEVLW